MKILLIMTLMASVSFAQKKTDKKAAAAAAITKMNVGGHLNWTGFGVGKSHTGELQIKSGEVEMKGDDLVGGNFVIDMTSLKTGDSPRLQTHLQSEDFFNIKAHPEATFKITKAEKLPGANAGTPNYKITGDLTIKGKKNPEEFTAQILKNGKTFTAKAETEIKDRTAYDIVYRSAKFETASKLGDKMIEDRIKVQLELTTK